MSARTYQSVYVYLLKWVPRTYSREYAYLPKCLRVLTEVSTSYLFSWICALVVVVVSLKSPKGAILFHSPGRKPWVRHWYPFFLSSFRSGTPPTASPQRYKPNVRAESAAPEGAHIIFRFVCTQGFISGLPSFYPGLCRSIALKGLSRQVLSVCFILKGSSTSRHQSIYFVVLRRCAWGGLQKDKFCLFFCWALQNAVIARHWDWRCREFTPVNDQAWMSKITQRVPYYAMVFLREIE